MRAITNGRKDLIEVALRTVKGQMEQDLLQNIHSSLAEF
jgi:hypothetical protein